MTTIAKRIKSFSELDESVMSYWKVADGSWLLWLPGCGLAGLAGHKVEEHSDGTITVNPSIKTTGGETNVTRHGWLTRGVWKDA